MSEKQDVIPPAAVSKLRAVIAKWRREADETERELGGIRKSHPEGPRYGIAAVRSCADELDALVARVEPPPQALHCTSVTYHDGDGYHTEHDVTLYRAAPPFPPTQEPPPQEQILVALEAAQQFLDPAVPRGPDVYGWANTVDLVDTILAAHRAPPTQEPASSR